MKYLLPVLTTSLMLTGATVLFGQATAPADKEHGATRARADMKKGDPDVSYGRVKEMTAGQKVVIDVNDAPDKEFDLTDKDVAVKLGKGLKVGDTVKISEHSVMGKTKSVSVMKHSGGGVTHGDKDPAKKP